MKFAMYLKMKKNKKKTVSEKLGTSVEYPSSGLRYFLYTNKDLFFPPSLILIFFFNSHGIYFCLYFLAYCHK